MADNGVELRSVAWSHAFPFVRLFQTLRLALDFKRLTLALAAVLLSYIGGRVLDGVWAKGGVPVMTQASGSQTEIQAYAELSQSEFNTWQDQVESAREERGAALLVQAKKAEAPEAARKLLESESLRKLLLDDEFKQEIAALKTLVDERLAAGLKAGGDEQSLTAYADTLRIVLAAQRRGLVVSVNDYTAAIAAIACADPAIEPQQQHESQTRLRRAVLRISELQAYERLAPQGPYISLLTFESNCFAAAIQGVCAGRWGFANGAFTAEPSMAGSIVSAVRGGAWVITRRPWFALICGVLHLLIFGYFGGALCRSAAVQSAREESISLAEALHFAREKYSGFVLAPALPIIVFLVIALAMLVGGLVGTVPYLGELFTGALYPLALLGGFALAIILLATMLGFHLMWPTIAVEGSDGFDALSRAYSYVGNRIWHVGFYSFVLLLYGGASFVFVRLVAALTLKLAHSSTKIGMNLASSAELDAVGKLDAMWKMPAWGDVSLLPSTGEMPFWGRFGTVPLDGAESLGAWLIALWVFLLVGLVGAFVVSFFFCGSTQMYFLLRRDVDATDWEEVYYEEQEEQMLVTSVPAGEVSADSSVADTPAETDAPDESSPDEPAQP